MEAIGWNDSDNLNRECTSCYMGVGVREVTILRDVHVVKMDESVDQVVGVATVKMFLTPPRCLVH